MAAIRVSLAFRRGTDAQLLAFAVGVFDSLTGNVDFPDPPFALAELANATQVFEKAVIAAADGGKGLKASRTAKRKLLLQLLRELAAYVQFAAKGDSVKLMSAGFFAASRNTAQTPLPKPHPPGLFNCASTQLQLKVKPLKNARMYEAQIHTGDGNWRTWQLFRNTRRMILKNLTPGTLYWVRVRAHGGSTGASEWSDATSHMSI